MSYAVGEVGQRTDADGNTHQEDCLFPAAGKQQGSDRLLIVCDGMAARRGRGGWHRSNKHQHTEPYGA